MTMAEYKLGQTGSELQSIIDHVETFDSAPTAGSQKAVTSAGIKAALDEKANQATTYTKEEINNLLNPIGAEIVWVAAEDWPLATGEPNTIYCVQGSTSFTCYGWTGSEFQELATYNWLVDAVPTEGSTKAVSSGGVYNAVKSVADDMEAVKDVVDITQSVNLFDKTKATDGYFVRRDDGTLTANATYIASDYITINEAGLNINLQAGGGASRGYAVYNANKEFIRGSTAGQITFQTGDVYARFTSLLADKDSIMVVRGTSADMPSSYVAYGKVGEIADDAVGTSSLKDEAVTEAKVADDAITVNKIHPHTIAADGANLLDQNDPDFLHENKYFINRNNGVAAHTTASTNAWGYTGFIPAKAAGLYCNCSITGGSYGGAVYDANKAFLRGFGSQYTYQEGDKWVRYTLGENPVSPYTSGQLMVNEGADPLPYEVFSGRTVIDPDILPAGSDTDSVRAIAAEVVAPFVPEICLPDLLPVVVGDTLRIYWRSIVKAPDVYAWDVYAKSNVGKSYPRYYLFTPTSAGNYSVTFYVRNAAGNVVAQKTATIKAVNAMSSPATNKKILMLGASMMADGNISYELNRRLTSTTGDGTPLNPRGLGLTNISFVGRLTGSSRPYIHQEARGGWSWADYATIGRQSYRFFVTGVDLLHIGDKYRDSNSNYTFTIAEINVTAGAGNIRCTFTGDGALAASGTLTLTEGTGDASITYTSCQFESGNPFWDVDNNVLDFVTYANDYCGGSIDVICSFTGLNDFTNHSEAELARVIEDYIKPFARAFHAQFPSALLLQCTLSLGSPFGGMAASYGASGIWNYYTAARKIWKYAELLRAMEADPEFSPFFHVVETAAEFDAENLYPVGNFTVANRLADTEILQTNGVHSTQAGKYTIADSIYEVINDTL